MQGMIIEPRMNTNKHKFVKMDSCLRRNDSSYRRGAALLVVLGVVMVITIVAFAYLSRSDGELQYGQNMSLRMQVDYLAESGLEHARGLILNPQEVSGEYWTGATSPQQLEAGDFYYDVSVEPNTAYSGSTRWCNYDISCQAYRLSSGERTAQSNLSALLRLNPCVAYYCQPTSARQISSVMRINGDLYCDNDLVVFCDNLSGTIAGQDYPSSELSLDWPRVDANDFLSNYSTQVQTIGSPSIGPYSSSGICHRTGDLEITDSVQITGMLIVEGDLRISGTGNLVRASKALPAMLVTGDVIIDEGAEVNIEGLAVVEGAVNVNVGCEDVNVLGGLFAGNGIVETIRDSAGELDAVIHSEPVSVTEGGHAAFSFDGSDDYARTEDSSSEIQITGDYTLAVWVKANPTQKSWAGIISKTDSGGSTNHWTLQFNNSNPRELIIHHPSGTWDTGIKINNIASQWHHIAVTRSGFTMTSYLDGDPKGTGFVAVPGSGTGHLNIGVNRTASSSYAYSGLIDDIRIYSRPLEPNEIDDVMSGVGSTNGLIAHWKLDEDGQRRVTVTAAPCKTAIWCWSASGDRKKWAQAAGAFYKMIRRN
jgi:hypothetical protein